MAPTIVPQKRALTDSTNTHLGPPTTPASGKKRKVELPSSPAFTSSQKGASRKITSSQPKSTFESDVLDKFSQDISDLKQNNAEKDQDWQRPPVADFDPATSKLCFQAIEAEEGTIAGGKPTVKLFGVSEKGNSVVLHVTDFKHYLFIEAPVSFQPSDCPAFKAHLENAMHSHQPMIHSVTFAMRMNIYGFQGNMESPYLKITVTDPKHIPKVRGAIERSEANWKGMWQVDDGPGRTIKIRTFDNIQYVLRFMVDCHVSGSSRGNSQHHRRHADSISRRSKECPGWKPLPANISCCRVQGSPTARSRPK
jgi:DNA polymerase delta subunit 1